MANEANSGWSIFSSIFMVLVFLSILGRIVTRCGHDPYETRTSHEEYSRFLDRYNTVLDLYDSSFAININEYAEIEVPGIAKLINDTSAYDKIYEVKNEKLQFFIFIKSTQKKDTNIFIQWSKFKKSFLGSDSIEFLSEVYRINNLIEKSKDVQIMIYNYNKGIEPVKGLVRIIEKENTCAYIEIETAKKYDGFYDISEIILQNTTSIKD